MLWRSNPQPDAGWWPAVIAVLAGIFLPALAGAAVLYFGDAPLSGAPKDGTARTVASHAMLVAAALTAAPLIAWLAAPLAVPLLRLAVQRGWAGWGSAVGLAVGIGLPIVHFVLHGDVTTEDQSVLPHILAALAVQGSVGWLVLRGLRNPTQN